MSNIEKPFSPEVENLPPFPNTQDLVLIDGEFAQCVSADKTRVVFIFIEDREKSIIIKSKEWKKYNYTKPNIDESIARDLVKKGLMNEKQLAKVHWGSEAEKYQKLKGDVTFFGTYTKNK